MDTFIVDGGNPLRGTLKVSGAKNVALKAGLASLLTDDEVILHNIPTIADVSYLFDMLRSMGVRVAVDGNSVRLKKNKHVETTVPLEVGARLRTSSMAIGPLLARYGEAKIPNPGGCRIGARPIDRHIRGLQEMGADIGYYSKDGYYHAKAKKLLGVTHKFPKNTHTGTETLILAGVLAQGTTVLQNAAEEVEVDDLIALLNAMGANIKRTQRREIMIKGVSKLHGAQYSIMPDRNEEVTFAIAAIATGGDITVTDSQRTNLDAFLEKLEEVGGKFEAIDATTTRYTSSRKLKATDVVTGPHPGFMTDWQAPWALLMTQASGTSTIHETVFESRFSYVGELQKMGAKIEFFDPNVVRPTRYYNFNWEDRTTKSPHGIKITGPVILHNAIVEMSDLRAGATLLLASLVAHGISYIHGVEQIDRGYEKIEKRLNAIGARIVRRSDKKFI